MDDTSKCPLRQPYRAARDTFQTPAQAEAYFLRFPTQAPHPGRPVETIGQTLQRMIDRVPAPLPDDFRRRLAVSIVEDPEFFGRLFAHAVREFQRAGGGREN